VNTGRVLAGVQATAEIVGGAALIVGGGGASSTQFMLSCTALVGLRDEFQGGVRREGATSAVSVCECKLGPILREPVRTGAENRSDLSYFLVLPSMSYRSD
jgi:hypothetical protein